MQVTAGASSDSITGVAAAVSYFPISIYPFALGVRIETQDAAPQIRASFALGALVERHPDPDRIGGRQAASIRDQVIRRPCAVLIGIGGSALVGEAHLHTTTAVIEDG